MNLDVERLQAIERWIAWVRLAAVPFSIVEVGLLSTDYPSGYELWAWATTGLLALGGLVFYRLSRSQLFARAPQRIGLLALGLDTVALRQRQEVGRAADPQRGVGGQRLVGPQPARHDRLELLAQPK
jgi:hypothetical protein